MASYWEKYFLQVLVKVKTRKTDIFQEVSRVSNSRYLLWENPGVTVFIQRTTKSENNEKLSINRTEVSQINNATISKNSKQPYFHFFKNRECP